MINIVKQYGKPSNYVGGYGASASGVYEVSTTEQTTIDIGFKPRYLAIQAAAGATNPTIMTYSEDYSTTTYKYATAAIYSGNRNLNADTDYGRLFSINENGFTVAKNNVGVVAFTYFAVG